MLKLIWSQTYKRPTRNPYIRFYKSILPTLKCEFPGKGVVVLSPEAGKRWKSLGSKGQQLYKKLSSPGSTIPDMPKPTLENVLPLMVTFVESAIRHRNKVQRWLHKQAQPTVTRACHNPFIKYYQQRFAEIKLANPGHSVTVLSKIATDEWNTLTAKEKARYQNTSSAALPLEEAVDEQLPQSDMPL